MNDKEHFFMIGWYRSRHDINHATRRQIRKAAAANCLEELATGWYLQQLFCVLFDGHPKLAAKYNDMGLPMAFIQRINHD